MKIYVIRFLFFSVPSMKEPFHWHCWIYVESMSPCRVVIPHVNWMCIIHGLLSFCIQQTDSYACSMTEGNTSKRSNRTNISSVTANPQRRRLLRHPNWKGRFPSGQFNPWFIEPRSHYFRGLWKHISRSFREGTANLHNLFIHILFILCDIVCNIFASTLCVSRGSQLVGRRWSGHAAQTA